MVKIISLGFRILRASQVWVSSVEIPRPKLGDPQECIWKEEYSLRQSLLINKIGKPTIMG